MSKIWLKNIVISFYYARISNTKSKYTQAMATLRRSPRLMKLSEAKSLEPVSDFLEKIMNTESRYEIVEVTKKFLSTYKINVDALTFENLMNLDMNVWQHCVVLQYIVHRMVTPNTPGMKAYLSFNENKETYKIGLTPVSSKNGIIHYRRFIGDVAY